MATHQVAAAIPVFAILTMLLAVGPLTSRDAPVAASTGNVSVTIPGGGHGGPSPTPSPTGPPIPPCATTLPSGQPGAPVILGAPGTAGGLVITPARAKPGDLVQVRASGLRSREQVQLVLYPGGRVLGSFPADRAGVLTASVRLPRDIGTGRHTIEATGWSSCRPVNGTLTIMSPPGLPPALPPWLLWIYIATAIAVAICGIWLGIAMGWIPRLLGYFRPAGPGGGHP